MAYEKRRRRRPTAGTTKSSVVDHTGSAVTGAGLSSTTEALAYINKKRVNLLTHPSSLFMKSATYTSEKLGVMVTSSFGIINV